MEKGGLAAAVAVALTTSSNLATNPPPTTGTATRVSEPDAPREVPKPPPESGSNANRTAVNEGAEKPLAPALCTGISSTSRPLSGAVLFSDEMRLGLHGQVRRCWAPVGEKVEQVLQIRYEWTYLLLGVDPIGPCLVWEWVTHLKGAVLAPVIQRWREAGAAAVVLDNAPGHRGPAMRATTMPLVFLPPYSPELDPAERIFRALRPIIEGEVYATLQDKRRRADQWLRELAADPERLRSLVGWDWLTTQLAEGTARIARS